MTPVSKDTLNALNLGITSEIASYVFYLEAAKKKTMPHLKDILEDLAAEEKQHFQILERQHHSLIKSEQWVSTADILKADDLAEIDEEMSAVHRELIDEVRQAATVAEVLDIAYRLEEDAYRLFSGLVEKTDSDEGRKVYTELAKFEQGHMRKIDELRKQHA